MNLFANDSYHTSTWDPHHTLRQIRGYNDASIVDDPKFQIPICTLRSVGGEACLDEIDSFQWILTEVPHESRKVSSSDHCSLFIDFDDDNFAQTIVDEREVEGIPRSILQFNEATMLATTVR